ncbi:MAG: hypothetical protein ACM3IH_22860 [Sphingobacteriales bacterium]
MRRVLFWPCDQPSRLEHPLDLELREIPVAVIAQKQGLAADF